MSGKAPLTSRPLSNELYMLCVMDINCLIQKSFGLNPDWFNDIKLLLVKKLKHAVIRGRSGDFEKG